MSLFQLAEHVQITNNLKFPHKGRVVKTDKDEDKKLGRIKCVVKGMFEDEVEDKKRLPWVFPQNPYGLGGSATTSGFSVPELDSEVTVIFPFEDIYHPYYTGYWQSELTHQHSLFDEDYPHSYGWIDSVIHWLKVNKRLGDADEQSYIEFFRNYLGDLLRLDEEGNLWINIPKSVYIKVGEDIRTETIRDQIHKITGDHIVKIEKGDFLEVTENQTKLIGGNMTSRVTGAQEWLIGTTHGIIAGSAISHQAPQIDHNSGIIFGKAESDGADHDAELTDELAELQAKMDEMQAKIDELTAMADEIKSKADENRPDVALPDNIE